MSKGTLLLLYIEYNSGVNGLAKVFTSMANEFCNRGYDVVAVTSDEENTSSFFYLDTRVQWIKLGLVNIKYNIWDKFKREINRYVIYCDHPYRIKKSKLAVRKLELLLKNKKMRSIICYDHEAVLVANRLPKYKVPVIAMMHNSVDSILSSLNAQGIKEENKVDIHQVLMPSYVEKARQYLSTNICYIPNVVKECQHLPQRQNNTIISIGRLDPVFKRTDILIKSFGKLAALYPNWCVYIYGKAEIDNLEYEKYLHQLIKEFHLENRLFLCGTTHHIEKILCKADIFAFPSASEGFPLALTEAMAAGLPVVGFANADSVNELIRHHVNGILCDDGVENFAMGLSTLMKSETLRMRLGEQARKDIEQYSPKKVWDQWEALIETCNTTFSN